MNKNNLKKYLFQVNTLTVFYDYCKDAFKV